MLSRKWVVLLILLHKGKAMIISTDIFTSLAKISYVETFNISLHQLNYEARNFWLGCLLHRQGSGQDSHCWLARLWSGHN